MKFNLKLENIKYIKILYKNINENTSTTKAVVKSINEREIIALTKFDYSLKIKTPQEITLSIICNDGLYKTNTKLKSVCNEYPYLVFVLETPQNIEYQQKREYFRVSTQYKCVYTIFAENKMREFKTHTLDISANGISIFMPTLEISDEKSLIEIAFDNTTIALEIKYIRREPVEGGYKLSFSYAKISNSDQDFISQICIKKQLEQKRMSMQ